MNSKRILLIAAVVAGLAASGAYFARQKSAAARRAVSQLQTARGAKQMEALSDIVKQGDIGYSELARVLRAEETSFDRQYEKWRQRLPPQLRDQLPERPSKPELRSSIARIVNVLGPVGARALVPAVEYAVDDSDTITSLDLIRTLEWSVPESPRAVRILSNYVAAPSPQKSLFGMTSAPEIWRAVPQLAPLMVPWLKFSDQAGEAAEALGAMAGNSAFAVQTVAQVAEHGVAGDPPTFQTRSVYPPGYDRRVHNRAKAIRALGLIGTTNENVFQAFRKALTHEDQLLRCHAADGMGFLGPKALPLLPFLLDHLDRSNRLVLRFQIEAIGQMGPGATAAIPVLLQYSEKAAVDSVPEQPEPDYMIRADSEPMFLPFGAAFALALIDPDQARKRLETLAMALSFRNPPEVVAKLRPLKNDLLPLAEPHLKSGESPDLFAGFLALNLLRLDPQFKPALAVLERQLSAKTEPVRSYAALHYFHATGDTNKVLAALARNLKSGDDLQTVVQIIGELGPAAKPLASQIQPYLEHEKSGFRFSAGRTLRLISPESLPPVKETDD